MLLFIPLPVFQKEVPVCRLNADRELEKQLSQIQKSVVPKTIRFLVREGADFHTAQDIAQEAMLALVNNFRKNRYCETGNLQAYFYQISRRIWFKKRRKNKRLKILPLIEKDFEKRAGSLFFADQPELPETLLIALKSLSKRKRRILEMAYFEGLTHQDIADQIGKSRPYVKTTLARIRNELRKKCKG